MTLDDFARPNLLTLLGLGILVVAVPALARSLLPAVKSAIKLGIVLFTESEGDAEAELIQSLVAATLDGILSDSATPAGASERRHAVRRRIDHFKRQARRRAQRWASGEQARGECYNRYVASLEARLARHKEQIHPRAQKVIEDAFAALAQPA